MEHGIMAMCILQPLHGGSVIDFMHSQTCMRWSKHSIVHVYTDLVTNLCERMKRCDALGKKHESKQP